MASVIDHRGAAISVYVAVQYLYSITTNVRPLYRFQWFQVGPRKRKRGFEPDLNNMLKSRSNTTSTCSKHEARLSFWCQSCFDLSFGGETPTQERLMKQRRKGGRAGGSARVREGVREGVKRGIYYRSPLSLSPGTTKKGKRKGKKQFAPLHASILERAPKEKGERKKGERKKATQENSLVLSAPHF